jgi:glycosyltransferase involved in cell wall biosynthesis
MKLLVVMACNPFNPQSGSENIAFNNIQKLSENHFIDVISLDITNKKSHYESKNLKLFIVAESKKSRLLRIMFNMLYMSFSVTAFISTDMKKKVSDMIKHNKYDAVLLYEIGAIQYCNKSLYNKVILNIEDPQSIKMKRMSRLSVWTVAEKLLLIIRSKVEGLYEKHILPKVAKVLLLSKADLDDMCEKGFRGNFGLVTYGTTLINDSDIIPYENRTDGMIIFSGNMFHPPNIDGALFFLHRIYPLVLEEYPSATLWIVGANPDKRILSAAAQFGEHVVITGRVDDVSKHVKVAKVSICPVQLKIGVQTKILEALACGTPVVTTSAGNSGIRGVSGRDLWVEDEPSKFSSRIISLLKGESWDRVSVEGRKLVAANFTWARSASELEQHIKELSVNRMNTFSP